MCNGHFFYLMISRTGSRVSIDIEQNFNAGPGQLVTFRG